MKSIFALLFVLCSFCVIAQEESTFTDSRDGKTYKIITYDIPLIGGVSVKRTWMVENLNYEIDGSFCYSNEPAYCEVYGRLYTFDAALESCPEGWRLPTIKDWSFLASKFGGMDQASPALREGGESGMNLKLGGFGDPGNIYNNVGRSGNYWDAENRTTRTAGLVTIEDTPDVFHGTIGNYHRNSVRCIKDY